MTSDFTEVVRPRTCLGGYDWDPDLKPWCAKPRNDAELFTSQSPRNHVSARSGTAAVNPGGLPGTTARVAPAYWKLLALKRGLL